MAEESLVDRLAVDGDIREAIDRSIFQENSRKYTLSIPSDLNTKDIPIFINARDRVVCMKKQIEWLLKADYRKIYILDNDSTYGGLISYYDYLSRQRQVKIVLLHNNMGHEALWKSGILEQLNIKTPYIYTDPDILPTEDCPENLVDVLLSVLRRYPYLNKVGVGLKTDDLTYYMRDEKRLLIS